MPTVVNRLPATPDGHADAGDDGLEATHTIHHRRVDSLENDVPVSVVSTQQPSCGYSWVPTMELEPGMVLARRLFGGSRMRATIHLAEGSAVTASTIAQLVSKGVECVAVLQEELHDDATNDDIACRYEARLREIFGENPGEDCHPLFDALLAAGPSQC